MVLVGVHGAIGSGKDVVASYLCREHGFVRVGFADALKDEVLDRLPRTLGAVARLLGHGDADAAVLRRLVHEEKPSPIRELLQEMGTDVRRRDDPAYWTKRLASKLADLPAGARVVVPDVRFPNEAQFICRSGGALLNVLRPRGGPPDSHASETALGDWTDWDAVLVNDGSVADLEAKADVVVRGLPR